MSATRLPAPIASCSQCVIGQAAGVGHGQFCPFIDRARSASELIYLEGETASHVWFIKEGTVVLFRESGDQESEGRVRAVRFPGTFVGLEALVSESYIDSARASTDVVLCGATREGIDAWLGPKGTPERTALEVTLRAMCNDQIRRAAPDGNAVKRVAAWLSDEGPRSTTASLPRKLVADLLGMRPETLSRALAALAKQGAIESTRRTVRIIDQGLLMTLAGRDAESEQSSLDVRSEPLAAEG
jgi:CRP-like cAMP-binding protein